MAKNVIFFVQGPHRKQGGTFIGEFTVNGFDRTISINSTADTGDKRVLPD